MLDDGIFEDRDVCRGRGAGCEVEVQQMQGEDDYESGCEYGGVRARYRRILMRGLRGVCDVAKYSTGGNRNRRVRTSEPGEQNARLTK